MSNESAPSPEVREYLRQLGKKGGTKGAATTNAKLTPKQKSLRAKKGGEASTAKLTPEQRRKRASDAARARWAAKEEKVE